MSKKVFLGLEILAGAFILAACGGGGGGGDGVAAPPGDPTSRIGFSADPAWGSGQSLDISGTTRSGDPYSQDGVALTAATTYVDLPYGQYDVVWHHDVNHAGHYNGDEHHRFTVSAPNHHYGHH
ncbi:MAG: hypothetical protein LBI87_07350 [Candidatus Accumulibacter sp.]|jgi:hypothetical protein|nr:hypothetical protein [Accumulibacter sp.]